MGIQERKEREREEQRERILEAAARLLASQGVEKTSLRGIAQAIEYSPASIYLHFKDKSELFAALFLKIFKQFSLKLQEAEVEPHPILRMLLLGEKYLEFARQSPEKYELMFVQPHPDIDFGQFGAGQSPSPTENCAEDDVQQDEGFDVLLRTIQFVHEAGYMLRADVNTASMVAWSQVHGMALLEMRGFMKMIPQEHRGYVMEQIGYSILPAVLQQPPSQEEIHELFAQRKSNN